MGGCAAINCSNHSRNKFRMFRFPTDPVRRRKWTINCRREGWVPGPRAELCSAHFEESQYEQHRADKVKKLKPNAVPTLFNFHSPPASKRMKEKDRAGYVSDCSPVNHVETAVSTVFENSPADNNLNGSTVRKNLEIRREGKKLQTVDAISSSEKGEKKQRIGKKKQGGHRNDECSKKQNPNMKNNVKSGKRTGADALLVLLSDGSLTGISSQRSLLKNNTNNNMQPLLSTKISENQPKSVSTNSETTENPSTVSDSVTSSMQEFNEECFEMRSDEDDSEDSTDSEEILFLENETEDSKEILKEKLRKLTVCYKNSQKKLKEYQRLCKLYVNEVTALRQVITNLKQINSIADNMYFEAKS